MAGEITPYQTAMPFATGLAGWLDQYEAQRIASYTVYDSMYKNSDGNTEAMLRGSVDLPIYVPSAKGLINTMARYVGRGFGFAVDPTMGTTDEQIAAITAYNSWFDRERITTKFKMAVKECMKFGDSFWYIYADANKPEGSRVSIKTVDPAMVFPILLDEDPDKVVGYMIVEQVENGDEVVIRRQRWLKNTSPDHPNFGTPEAPVVYDRITLEIEGWNNPEDQTIVSTEEPQMYLPKEIIQLPIYHWKNNEESSNPYGVSEISGLERLIAGINQALTDQDFTLAMQGLGMYKSDKGGPVDAAGNDIDWELGPGKVIEDETFGRVDGVSTVAPFLEHIRYIEEKLDAIVGITDVTRGAVSAEVAESGIALSIRMSPTIDTADDKDAAIKAVFDQLLHDMKAWFQAFEGWNFSTVRIFTQFGDKMPRNRAAELEELDNLLDRKVISTAYYRRKLQESYGYEFDDTIIEEIAADVAMESAGAAPDPYAGRLDDESASVDEPPAGE